VRYCAGRSGGSGDHPQAGAVREGVGRLRRELRVSSFELRVLFSMLPGREPGPALSHALSHALSPGEGEAEGERGKLWRIMELAKFKTQRGNHRERSPKSSLRLPISERRSLLVLRSVIGSPDARTIPAAIRRPFTLRRSWPFRRALPLRRSCFLSPIFAALPIGLQDYAKN